MLAWKIFGAKTEQGIPQQEKPSDRRIDLCSWKEIRSLNDSQILEHFPYQKYVEQSNFWSIASIKQDIICLDTIFRDKGRNRQTISFALTRNLATRLSPYLKNYHPDSLLILLQWAEKFKVYPEIDEENKILYLSIYDYWMDTIGHRLSELSIERPSRNHDFLFRYLFARCAEQRVSPAVKFTSTEKVINNIIYNKWGHFLNATWNQTSFLQKMVLFIFLFATFFGYVLIIQKIITFFSNKRK